TGAPALRYFLVMATIVEDAQPARVGNFVVPADSPGVSIEQAWQGLALRSSGSDDLVLDDVPLPADALLDERAPAAPDPRGALGLPWGALIVSSVYTGLALAARDECVEFAASRVPSGLGRPIATIPSVQRRLGEIEALLLTSHRLLYGLAVDWVERPEARPMLRAQGALVKTITTNNAVSVTDLALRVIGGAGLRLDMRAGQLFRDARAGLINAPLDDIALQNAGKASADAAARSVS
ncbi:MAG TPA: acyl-CoA dehydrogenase, partial [Ktedonobacterales bacterium]